MTILEILSLLFMFVGGFFLFSGSVGLIRLADAYSRLHALTKADLLGFGFVVLGAMFRTAGLWEALKLLVVLFLVAVYSALVGYAVAYQKRKREDV